MENKTAPSTASSPLLIRVIAIAMSLFQLYTGIFQLTAMNQRVIHVTFALVLIFLLYGFDQKKKTRIAWHGYLMSGIVLLMGIYVLANWFKKIGECGMCPPWYELAMGTVFLLMCIEAARRTLGMDLSGYRRSGHDLRPASERYCLVFLAHRNYSFERIVSNMFITTDGVFGMLAGISATYIFLFILFGALLRAAGRRRVLHQSFFRPFRACSRRPGQNRCSRLLLCSGCFRAAERRMWRAPDRSPSR